MVAIGGMGLRQSRDPVSGFIRLVASPWLMSGSSGYTVSNRYACLDGKDDHVQTCKLSVRP